MEQAMIANQVKGAGFRGCLNYVLDKGHNPELIGGNMVGKTPRQLAAEFKISRELNPRVQKAVYHVSLSVPNNEKISDPQWKEISEKYLNEMGFKNNQFVIVKHNDTEHNHVHIIASRIRMDTGKAVTDSQDYHRSAKVIQQIERQYGLSLGAKTPKQANEMDIKAPRRTEIEKAVKNKTPSVKDQLKDIIQATAQGTNTMSDFVPQLEKMGVGMRANIQGTGRIAGVSFELNHIAVKGSQLGKSFSWNGLQKKLGIEYEKDRDFQIINSATERANSRQVRLKDQGIERGRDKDGGGVLSSSISSSSSGCKLDRRTERNTTECKERSKRTDRSDQELENRSCSRDQGRENRECSKDQQRISGSDQGSRGHQRKQLLDKSENVWGRLGNSDNNQSWRDRLVDLSPSISNRKSKDILQGRPTTLSKRSQTLTKGTEHTRQADQKNGPDKRNKDRTVEAAKQHMDALKVDRFEVGIRRVDGKMLNREWSKERVLNSINWLKRENAKGSDIYIRPAPTDGKNQGVILVDDLKDKSIAQMKQDGFSPAAVVETSPNNYQAWIRVSLDPLDKKEATEIAKDITHKYGGDPNSADWRHYGRLAGFTNRKPKHVMEDGRSPYTKIHVWDGKKAEKSDEFVQKIKTKLHKLEVSNEQHKRMDLIKKPTQGCKWFVKQPTPSNSKLKNVYAYYAKRIVNAKNKPVKPNNELDWSKVDYRVSCDLAKAGLNKKEIREAINEGSPNLADRKAGHKEDYLKKTVDKSFKNSAVKKAIKNKSNDFEMSR